MHDVDVFGRDQSFQLACGASQLEWIGRGIDQRHPFAAEALQLRDERAVPATSARAPACSSARVTISAVRAAGSSRSAGTICRTIAPANVRGERSVSPCLSLTDPASFDRRPRYFQ